MTPNPGRLIESADGTTIWADDGGNKDGIPVVFIHGLASVAVVFDLQFNDPDLQKNLYMVRYDLRGHGRSGIPFSPESYTGLRYAEDFMAVCKAFGLVKPFVCGWSYGALIPVDVTEYFGPDQIAGVIYPSGPAFTLELHKEYIHPTLLSLQSHLLVKDGDQLPQLAELFVNSSTSLKPTEIPYDIRVLTTAAFLMQPPTVRLITATRPQKSERWHKEFTGKPHLLVQGSADQHSQPDKLISVAKRVIPGIEIQIVEGAGHALVMEEGAGQFNKYMLDFVLRHQDVRKV